MMVQQALNYSHLLITPTWTDIQETVSLMFWKCFNIKFLINICMLYCDFNENVGYTNSQKFWRKSASQNCIIPQGDPRGIRAPT